MSQNKKQESSDKAMNLCPQLSSLVNEIFKESTCLCTDDRRVAVQNWRVASAMYEVFWKAPGLSSEVWIGSRGLLNYVILSFGAWLSMNRFN